MSKAIMDPLSKKQMVEDMNRLAVLAETRGPKVSLAMYDTRWPCINGDRQVKHCRPDEQAHGARGSRFNCYAIS